MSTLLDLPGDSVISNERTHFDNEVSRVIGETVSDLIHRDGDIIYGDLIHALARSARVEASQQRRALLLCALDRLLGDQPAQGLRS
ncbi:universal stress protein [Edwardsiella piscicida]|uniref:Uncharacterized protein n=3 Tax=Edwardsiella TaxID=635 RepID=A0A0H3DSE1_EDWTF|nr:hypothetical protein [Edwardsiella piscicida]ACY84317.1 hypothetical protein ETAE_1476 [Edwardsiella tarda EIB202]ADM41482.1 hypothetical protein ETAF_1370 [Edwardsiella tarda FL6-60]AGH73509.1 hypothetical protein ETAC_06940 [Edwardsiella piscicida C07-087]AOP42808.1 universal stress protein [Edwardsiella piscicida]ARD16978.1 universal stress protein [Edwardsiella piscicida]